MKKYFVLALCALWLAGCGEDLELTEESSEGGTEGTSSGGVDELSGAAEDADSDDSEGAGGSEDTDTTSDDADESDVSDDTADADDEGDTPVSLTENQQAALDAHNNKRVALGVVPMTWSNKVAKSAQAYADKRCAENNCDPKHSTGSGYGENLAWSSGQGLNMEFSVGMWIAEEADYDYASNTCTEGKVCGHYTQVVWAKSTKLGCGQSTNGKEVFIVCQYDPPGNGGTPPY